MLRAQLKELQTPSRSLENEVNAFYQSSMRRIFEARRNMANNTWNDRRTFFDRQVQLQKEYQDRIAKMNEDANRQRDRLYVEYGITVTTKTVRTGISVSTADYSENGVSVSSPTAKPVMGVVRNIKYPNSAALLAAQKLGEKNFRELMAVRAEEFAALHVLKQGMRGGRLKSLDEWKQQIIADAMAADRRNYEALSEKIEAEKQRQLAEKEQENHFAVWPSTEPQVADDAFQPPPPAPEDAVALQIGTTTVFANMHDVPKYRRAKVAKYIQNYFDFVENDSYKITLKFRNAFLVVSDEDRFAAENVLSGLFTVKEYADFVPPAAERRSLIVEEFDNQASLASKLKHKMSHTSFVKAYAYVLMSEDNFWNCTGRYARSTLLPLLMNEKLNPRFRADIVGYLSLAIQDTWHYKPSDWFQVCDALIAIFRDSRWPLYLRGIALNLWTEHEKRPYIIKDNFEYIFTNTRLFPYSRLNLFSIVENSKDSNLEERLLAVMENPHSYPKEIVSGACDYMVNLNGLDAGGRYMLCNRDLAAMEKDKDDAGVMRLCPDIIKYTLENPADCCRHASHK